MNIPNVPKAPMHEDNTAWRVYNNQIVNQLQEFLSDERYKLPSQSDTDVTKLNDATDSFGNKKNPGSILFNETSKSGQINTDGIYKNLGTYEELTTTGIGDIPSGQRNGRFILDTDSGDFKVGVNDIFKTVTLT